MKRNIWSCAAAAALAVLTGCVSATQDFALNTEPVKAERSAEPVKIDGVLDDAVWSRATAYALDWSPKWNGGQPPLTRAVIGDELREPGTVKVAWDDDYIYFGFDFSDSDVIAQVEEDQELLFQSGDVAEVFIKPANARYYWESYVNPSGNKTSLFFPSRGYLGLPDMFKHPLKDLKVAAKVNGTLNDYHDTDRGWTGEMAVPVAELEQYGMKFDPETPWTVFFGRYNYSLDLPYCENSSYPVVPILSYHLNEYYLPLELAR